jgi:hypothetical protein
MNFAQTMSNSEYSRLSKLDADEYYHTPEGYVVFTEKYLLKRGYCCQNGCRHCPYGFNKSKGRFDKK